MRVAKTKALISFAVTYTDCWFSHVVAQMFMWYAGLKDIV